MKIQRRSRRGYSVPSAFWQTSRVERFCVLGETVSAIVGQGRLRPVVFLHGNSSVKVVWANQLEAVHRQGHSFLAPDLPGHGESEDSASAERTYSLPGYSAVISRLLDALRWDCVDVVGWSLGGHIGLQLLATDRRIRSLLIVGTPPVAVGAKSLREAFYESAEMNLAGKAKFGPEDAWAYGSAMMGGREHLPAELLGWIRRTDGAARAHLFASALRGVGVDQKELVETVDKPLCVVHGEMEPFVRLDYLYSLRYRALWEDRIFVIANAGHAPHWQRPSVFNSILLKFLIGAKSNR